MKPDDEVCLCFHITKRKIVNFIRVEKPKVVSQVAECGGAGTGYGIAATKVGIYRFSPPLASPGTPADQTGSINTINCFLIFNSQVN